MTTTLPNFASRPSLGDLLVMAAAVAALGLGGARLAAELGGGQSGEAPPVLRAAAPAAPEAGPETAERGPWPAMFGLPAPPPAEPVAAVVEDPAPPAAEVVEEEPEAWGDTGDYDEEPMLDYRLKGMVATDGSGWILVEVDGEEAVYRVGDALPGGERILSITPEGALIEDPYGGPDVLLAPEEEYFDEDPDLPAARIDAGDAYGAGGEDAGDEFFD